MDPFLKLIEKPILESILDTDVYSFSMGEFFWRRLRNAEGIDRLVNRKHIVFPPKFDWAMRAQIEMMADLTVKEAEIQYLESAWPFLKRDYSKWFRTFRYDPKMVTVKQTGGDLDIQIEGPEYLKVYYEVPVLRLIPNLYYPMMGLKPIPEKEYRERARLKAKKMYEHAARWASFPTRRPASSYIHEAVLQEALAYQFKGEGGGLVGESNGYLAYKYSLKPIGTEAHRLFMIFGALYGYDVATTLVLRMWDEEFEGKLGVILTDTFTTPFFLKFFTREFAAKASGTREDSMIHPEDHAVMLSNHYKKLDLDPLTKTFSPTNGLTMDRAIELNDYVISNHLLAYSSAGIGGFFGNDAGLPPIDPVIKPFFTRWIGEERMRPCVKKSDNPAKSTGDPEELAKLDKVIEEVMNGTHWPN